MKNIKLEIKPNEIATIKRVFSFYANLINKKDGIRLQKIKSKLVELVDRIDKAKVFSNLK